MAKIAHWLFDQKHKGEKLFFSLFLLFLPTQLGKHFWPNYSYLLGIRSDYLSPTLYFTDVLIIGLLIVWMLNVIKHLFRFKYYGTRVVISSFNTYYKILNTNYRYLFIGLFFYLLITLLFSNSIGLGLYGLWKLMECCFIALYVAKQSAKIISFSQMIFLLSLGGVGESFLAILQFINQGSLNGIFYFFGERTFTSQTIGIANMSLNGTELLRPYATFSHPNVLAGYLMIISTFLLFAFWKKYTPFSISHFYYLISYFVCSLALLLTYGRVAIICWILTIIVFIIIQLRKKQKIMTVFSALLFFLTIFLFALHFQLIQRFNSLTLSDESVTQRENLLSASWQLFSTHPLFGVGLHNFLPSLSRMPSLQLNYFLLQPVHNIFVLVGVELGVVGVVLFVWFIAKTLRYLFNNWQMKKNNASYSFLCMILLLQIIMTGMFDHYWLTLQQGQLLFSLVLGMCCNKYFY